MKTDSFFFHLFNRLPQTLFELLGLPGEHSLDYQFDSVELKKSLRLDGLFRPNRPDLPAYFVEVQFYSSERYYSNLFAKVFLFLDANPAIRDWRAVAVFESRKLEPSDTTAYEDLLESQRVTRIYLDEIPISADAPIGVGIAQMVCAREFDLRRLVDRTVQKAKNEISNRDLAATIVELVEELLFCRFAHLGREEIRKMFHLTDIRETAVWREVREEGIVEGIEKGIEKGIKEGIKEGIEKGVTLAKHEIVRNCLANGMPVNEIAKLVGLPAKDIRRLAKQQEK